MKKWFVINTKPHQEELAKDNLERQDFRVFLPISERQIRRRGKWVTQAKSLFPRYLFIELDLGIQSIAPIRSTLGVSGLVRFGEQPTAVPNDFMNALLNSRNKESGLVEINQPLFKAGDQVTITNGPLAGLKGILQLENQDERVAVLLNMMGHPQTIKLSRDQIKPSAT